MERGSTQFTRLNDGWNAEPGAPHPVISFENETLVLKFYLNPWAFSSFTWGDVGELRFPSCWRYRLGETNDEGWWRRQCRFSLSAPSWGEFYEVEGDLRLEKLPCDAWTQLISQEASGASRHFLFYFKDETFECDAASWSFRVIPAAETPDDLREVTVTSGHSVMLVPPPSSKPPLRQTVRRPWFWAFLPSSIRRWLSTAPGADGQS